MIRNGFLSWEEEGEVRERRDENAKSDLGCLTQGKGTI